MRGLNFEPGVVLAQRFPGLFLLLIVVEQLLQLGCPRVAIFVSALVRRLELLLLLEFPRHSISHCEVALQGDPRSNIWLWAHPKRLSPGTCVHPRLRVQPLLGCSECLLERVKHAMLYGVRQESNLALAFFFVVLESDRRNFAICVFALKVFNTPKQGVTTCCLRGDTDILKRFSTWGLLGIQGARVDVKKLACEEGILGDAAVLRKNPLVLKVTRLATGVPGATEPNKSIQISGRYLPLSRSCSF